jgi:DNA-binding GntR family transcriptional regulator
MGEAALHPALPGTTAQHALDALRAAIVAGELRPGQHIVQDALAERLGISTAPVREALRLLEQEGQVTYRPRRGYSVTELRLEDLEEIYELRQVLEERAARAALPMLGPDELAGVAAAAADCAAADERGDIAAELQANRRFHLGLLAAPDHPQLLRVIRLLWDSTEAYRALYYNLPEERSRAADAHQRIIDAARRGDADELVAELDRHRARALDVLRGILRPPDAA